MFVFYIFEVYILGTFFKYLFYGLIAFGVGCITREIYHHTKASYVLDNIEEVVKIEFIKPTQSIELFTKKQVILIIGDIIPLTTKLKRCRNHWYLKVLPFSRMAKQLNFK